MRPQVVSVTGVANSAWIPVDNYSIPTNISLHAVVNGTVTTTIQYTVDDIQDSTVTPTAFSVTGMSAISANTAGNIAFPVRAIRISNTAGTGSTTLTILQSRSLA